MLHRLRISRHAMLLFFNAPKPKHAHTHTGLILYMSMDAKMRRRFEIGMATFQNCNFSEMTTDGTTLRSYLGMKRSRAPTIVIPLKLQLLCCKAFPIATIEGMYHKPDFSDPALYNENCDKPFQALSD